MVAKAKVRDGRSGRDSKSLQGRPSVPLSRGKNIPGEPPAESSDQRFQWNTNLLDAHVSTDVRCRWTWDISPEDLKELLGFLGELSQQTWSEIERAMTGSQTRRPKHHSHAVPSLCKAAQDRLAQVTDGSYPELFRFRYGGKQRLWGVRDRAVFMPIWLDLDHQVYPQET